MNTKGSVFLYAMMVSFFAVIISYIISTKISILIDNFSFQNYDSRLHSNIEEKANLAIGYDQAMNSNGGGFVNTLSCPTSLTMSGTISGPLETISTVPFFNGNIYCSGSTSSGNILISYASGFTNYINASYRGSKISLLGSTTLTGTFADTNSTYISFSLPGTFSSIDSNFNSDDYLPSSSGGVVYPSGFMDDDDFARRTIFGYVKRKTGWHTVFMTNTPLRNYIKNNLLNTGSVSTLGETSTGYLRLDADSPYSIKIVEFNKSSFDTTKKLRATNSQNAIFSTGGVGWIMPDLSLSGSSASGSRMAFDFKNKDYAIFLSFSGNLSYTGIDFLKYKITGENQYGSGVYITPINDSEKESIKYFGSEIIQDKSNNYLYKEFEVIRKK